MNISSNEDQCSLPRVLRQMVDISAAVYSMAMPRELMRGIFNCHGFSLSLFNANWDEQMREFPFLIALLCVSVFVTLLGVVWFVYEFMHVKIYRAENSLERFARLVLSVVLLILLLPYSLFLWIAFMSYYSVKSTNDDNKEMFETYYRSIQMPSNESRIQMRKIIGNLSKNLALQLEGAAPKIIQKGERSILAKITLKGSDLKPLLQNMQEELQSLMAYIMQLSDHARFLYRNTTTSMDQEQLIHKMYLDLIFKEFKANKQKIIMLLNIENVLKKIREIIDFSSTLNSLRQNLTSQMYREIYALQRDLNETVTKKSLEYTELNKNLSEMWTSVQRQTPPKADYHVEPYVNNFELAYCIVALLPYLLIVIYFERFLRRTSNRIFTRFLLMGIISLISTLLIFLCIFVILHFLHGATYYNYRKEIDENEDFCNVATLPYCSFHTETLTLLQRHLDGNFTTIIENYGKHTLKRLCGSILTYNSSTQHYLWLQELDDYAEFLEEVFRSGAMFEVVKQELYLENWYELYNILSTHASSKKTAREQYMLKCNLNMIRNYIFEQFFKDGIVVSLLKLTQQSTRLRSHLPSSNLTMLIKRVLREAQDLQDFCNILKNVLHEKTESFVELLTKEFEGFEPTFRQLPSMCGGLKFDSLGISHNNYMCIENSLQAFHIGAFGILILLFVVHFICICLAMLYEKSGAIGIVRVSSLSRIRSHNNNARGRLNRLPYFNRGATTIRRPTHVRFKETPTVSGNARLKKRYLTPENSEQLTKLSKKVQVKRSLAEPLQERVKERRRKRKFGLHKYLKRKLCSSIKRRLIARNFEL